MDKRERRPARTQPHAAVLQQVAQVVEHGFLVLAANATEVAQEATAAGHHLGEGDLLWTQKWKHKHKDVHPYLFLLLF